MTKSVILFDLDGTLTDPREGITRSLAHALAHFGIHRHPDSLTGYIGPPLRLIFADMGLREDQVPQAIEKYRERFSVTGMYENIPYPGIRELLRSLRDAGLTLAVATSKPHLFANPILERFALDGYFAFVSGSELDGTRDDKDEVIAYALEQLGNPYPAHCLMVGDRKYDIIGATKTGMQSIGVLYGYGSREELTEAGAGHLAASVDDLARLLERLTRSPLMDQCTG